MLRCGLLFAVVFVYANALTCPPSYTDGDDDICYKVYSNHSTYFDASAQCVSDGGRLASIHNAFTNNRIQKMAEDAGTLVWLGLKCADTDPKNCKWDDGQGAADAYNAFFQGNPSPVGECVLMMVGGKADGKWISGDCDNMEIGFACQVPKQAACGDYHEYGGKCYKGYDQRLTQDEAESYCRNECGHLASIHSAQENGIVFALFDGDDNYARIGLKQADGSFSWTDNTTYDYNNIGINNPAFGDCIAMSLVDELVEPEKWISILCGQALPFACKREQGACLNPTTTSAPTPATLSPPTCDAPYFLDKNGTFYSPGYPESYRNPKVCIYIMTATPGDVVEIHFFDLQLSTGSSIQLFNTFADPDPFEKITTDIPSNKYFTSTTNVMKMVFVAGNDKAGVNRWEAEFSSINKVTLPTTAVTITPAPSNPDGCNGNSIAPTNIASPNYPGKYPPLTKCRYQLTADPLYKINLTFGAIDTEQCCDIIEVYDFDGTPYYPLLDRFSGQIAAGVKTFKSSLNQMFVDFYSDSLNQGTGFTAYAIPDI
ncbi:hypothetical protein Y032_0015g2825 [Ancylostoma ceylanicum]|uniref:Lectin C-type domain protein n=1 Tax=Ancylostoma ceylanicum TaxID=53326 RepID=A0A016V8J7_9BILA|nr:hypothetical protein Y032_0015g2825 [Ancylostoma ceylanicum]